MMEINPYVRDFRYAAHYISNNPTLDLRLSIYLDRNADRRRYNQPTAYEVAAIVSGSEQERICFNREIIVYRNVDPDHPDHLQIISDYHSTYDSLHYVMMFPKGDLGWTPCSYRTLAYQNQLENRNYQNMPIDIGVQLNDNEFHSINIEENTNNNYQDPQQQDIGHNHQPLQDNDHNHQPQQDNGHNHQPRQDNGHNHQPLQDNDYDDYEPLHGTNASTSQSRWVSCADYYTNRLMRFEDSFLHCFGRLFQQFIVDSYCKTEHQKLRFIELNQSKLRTEMYRGIADAITSGDSDLGHTGRALILPSTFVGGPRYMANLFQDSMAIVNEFGKPDLFVTITCNLTWEEIQNEFLFGQTAVDIPDIVSRIFRLKLKAMLDMIIGNSILGKVVAHMYVIEFQKRVRNEYFNKNLNNFTFL